MTMTTEPTTTPEVPAWLNLDELVSPELRADCAAYIERMRTKLAEMMSDAFDAAYLHRRYCEETSGKNLPDIHRELSKWSGFREVEDLSAWMLHCWCLDDGYPSDETIHALSYKYSDYVISAQCMDEESQP